MEKTEIESVLEESPFDVMACEYDAWFDEDKGKLIFTSEIEAFNLVLPKLQKPWLEIGVGSGRFAQALGIETGIDPSRNILALAEKRGIKVFNVRGEHHFFSKNSFGAVFIILSLCFMDSPVPVLTEANRILKKDGSLVLGFIPRNSMWGKSYLEKKKAGHRFYKYASFYRYKEINKVLASSGFIIGRIVSTLFQKPGEVEHIELPREGFYPDAGFVIIAAQKMKKKNE